MEDLNSQEVQQRIQNQLEILSFRTSQIVKQGLPFIVKTNLVEAYTMVYDRCVEKPSKSQKMLTYFKQLMTSHLSVTSRTLTNSSYIKEFNKIHDSFMLYAELLIRRVFSYLDRYYLPSRDLGSLMTIAISIFYQNQLSSIESRRNLMNCFTITLGEYRNNLLLTDNELYKFSINIIKLNKEYYEEIKSSYFKQSEIFYRVKFEGAKDLPPAQFYPRVYNLSLFEETIAAKCFLWNMACPIDQGELKRLFVKEIVEPYTDILLSHPQGLIWALKFEKFLILNSVIEVATKFETLAAIKERYYEYVKDETEQLIKSLELQKDEGKIMSILVFFFQTHNRILINGFKKNQELQVTLSNAFETVFAKWDRYSEILFEYCKFTVKKGEFQEKEEKIRVVFEKLANKDEFIHRCDKWLQEILFSENTDFSLPMQFFNFLHNLCGSENTTRLQNLMKDYTSQNTMVSNQLLRPKVLSFHLWERRFKDELVINLKLPSSLDNLWKQFESQYTEMNPKKKLILLPLSSTLLIAMKFRQRQVMIRCNLVQSCLLLSLAGKGKTVEELQQQINAEKHLLESFIQLSKLIVMNEGVYEIDWSAEVPEKIDLAIHLQDNSKFTKAIEQDRSILLEAAVVRVLKRRKQASFEDIYVNLMQSIRMFKPQPAMVKSTIERLIKKDYIQQNQQGLYLYQQ